MSLLLKLFERTRRFWIVTHILLFVALSSQIGGYLLSGKRISGLDGWGFLLAVLATMVTLAALIFREFLHARPSAWLYSIIGVSEVGFCLGGAALFFLELFYEDLVVPVTILCLWLLMTGVRDLTMARTGATV